MLEEDLDPKTKKPALKNLEPMSVDELEAYIKDLEEEIARTQSEIEKKKDHQNAANAFFKS